MMRVWQPISNLREYVSHNPPGATFFLCLLSLALSFVCLSFYINTHTLPNPDKAKDWNYLLNSLSQWHLCVKENASSTAEVASVFPLLRRGKENVTAPNSTKSSSSVSLLHLMVPRVVATSPQQNLLKDVSLLTTFKANQLHLEGKEIFYFKLEIASENSNHTCLTISAPTHLLPLSLLPPRCPASEKNIPAIQVEPSSQRPTASQTCYRLQSKNDPALTVMLTPEEQSVAVRHLQGVSIGLFGVCLMISLAASLTRSLTRQHHWKELDLQSEALIDS